MSNGMFASDLEEKWYEVYSFSEFGSKNHELSTKKLEELGYFERAEKSRKTHQKEAAELAKTAKTEEEWSMVCLLTGPGSDLFNYASSKIEEIKESRRKKRRIEINNLVEELLAKEK